MTEIMLTLNYWLAVGVLLLEIGLVFLIAIYLYQLFDRENANKTLKPLFDYSQRVWGRVERTLIVKIFFLSLASSILTLVYSEIFGAIPCALCWFERIFMYGIVVISGVALFARNIQEEKGIFRYLLVYSVIGAAVSLYHHFLQISATAGSHLPCPASGGDCAKMLVFEFGHITFPWMAFVLFMTFVLIILIYKGFSGKQNQ